MQYPTQSVGKISGGYAVGELELDDHPKIQGVGWGEARLTARGPKETAILKMGGSSCKKTW